MTPDNLFAWVTTLPNGEVNVIGAWVPNVGAFTPLVVATERTARQLQRFAEAHRASTGQPCRLVRFTAAETLVEVP